MTVFVEKYTDSTMNKTEDRRGRKLAKSTQADTGYNIYFCAVNPGLGGQMLQRQQRDGVDAHSQVVDPLFVDPAKGDFRLKPGSPALKLGFVPIDVSKAGLVKATKK